MTESLLPRRSLLRGGLALAGLSALPRLQAAPVAAGPPVRLNANENPWGPSPRARRAALEAIAAGNRYPDAAPLTSRLAAQNGVAADQVVLAGGSYPLLCAAALALGGGEIVTADPTFPALASYAEARGTRVVRVPLAADHVHDLEALARAVTPATRLVYVCNPNNPTGTIVPADRLRAFCQEVGKRAVVLVDEAYREYATSPAFDSMAPLVAAGANVIVLHTFSKIHGLAGLRVGYAIARPDLAKALAAARMGSAETCLNSAGVAAALASLDDRSWLATCRADTARGRQELIRFLGEQGLRPAASEASFVYAPMPGDLEAFGAALEKRGVKIAARSRIAGCRITVGNPEEMSLFRRAFVEARKEIV